MKTLLQPAGRRVTVASRLLLTVFVAGLCVADAPKADKLLEHSLLQELGEKLFFDTNLSDPPGQSCATCHDPSAGWTGPDNEINARWGIYHGAVTNRFSNRKPNSAAYATFSPALHTRDEGGETVFVGGNFWDGRATGHLLGNAAADQAQGPFLNPVEQNNSSADALIATVDKASYAGLLRRAEREIWGLAAAADTQLKFRIVALAIAAFEHSAKVNRFSSKYDAFLNGKAILSEKEARGMEVFMGDGRCIDCHPMGRGPKGEPPLFTNFTYDNLGIPANPDNPWYRMKAPFNPDGAKWIDTGLGGELKKMPQYAPLAAANRGKHRTPTLRNVDKRPRPDFVKAFGHNGYFKSLESIVHFYNTRDVLPSANAVADPKPGINCWPRPEVPENVNTFDMGNLKLSAEDEAALVSFMRTLSDGYVPAAESPSRK